MAMAMAMALLASGIDMRRIRKDGCGCGLARVFYGDCRIDPLWALRL